VTGAVVLVLPLILTGTAVGQEPIKAVAKETVEFEVTAVGGAGLGEPTRRIDHAAWGGSLYGGWRLPGTPLSLGGRLTMANYGSEHNANLVGYSGVAPADVKYGYNLLTTHLVLRYQPPPSLFTPYLEASGGLGYFFTRVYRGNDSGTPIILGDTILFIAGDGSETLTSSLAPSLGLGGGLKVRLIRIGGGEASKRSPVSVSLNLQGRYVYIGTATYLKPGGLALDGDRLVAEPQRSHTDMVLLSLGISVGWGHSSGRERPPSTGGGTGRLAAVPHTRPAGGNTGG